MKTRRKTIYDFLPKNRKSEKFSESLTKKGIRIIRNGVDINENQPTEIYLNLDDLKSKGVEFLERLKNCKIFELNTLNHVCIRSYFVAFIPKLPGDNLNMQELFYQREIEAAGGKCILYHSVYELETGLLKLGLLSKRIF